MMSVMITNVAYNNLKFLKNVMQKRKFNHANHFESSIKISSKLHSICCEDLLK